MKYTNDSNFPLAVAAWLAYDSYPYNPDPKHISATTLMKPLRAIILSSRLSPAQQVRDIRTNVNNRIGTAIHDAIEHVWTKHKDEALANLGYPEEVIRRIVVNPTSITDDMIPVFTEKRTEVEFNGWTVSGELDFMAEATVEDFKYTKVFQFQSPNKAVDYRLQGSIYRWLNPGLIEEDHININFILQDWQASRAASDQGYPSHQVCQKRVPLMSLHETERWIQDRLVQLEKYWDAPETDLPQCSAEELWMGPPSHKYYKDPDNRKRATKAATPQNGTTLRDLQDLQAKNGCGIIVTVEDTATACLYCPAFELCSQKDRYHSNP